MLESKRSRYLSMIAGAIAIMVVAGVVWKQAFGPQLGAMSGVTPDSPSSPSPASERVEERVASDVPAAQTQAPPAIAHPVEPVVQAGAATPQDLANAVKALVKQDTEASVLQLNDLPHRVVATVDNLARDKASWRLWPVSPAPGRFTVDESDGRSVISPQNHARYEPMISMLQSIDTVALANVYKRFYPLFQRAYEELGYSTHYFNDRSVRVIDVLLATPEPAGPIAVELPQINGPVQPARPWIMYRFSDPQLQSLTAGQKILLRMGVDNMRRVKAVLRALKAQIATAGPRSSETRPNKG